MSLHISIPGYAVPTKNGMEVHIKGLGLVFDLGPDENFEKTASKRIQEQLGSTIKHLEISWYEPFHSFQKEWGFKHFLVISKDWDKLVRIVLNHEPLVETAEKARRAKKSSHLIDVSPEEVVNYGYPEGDEWSPNE